MSRCADALSEISSGVYGYGVAVAIANEARYDERTESLGLGRVMVLVYIQCVMVLLLMVCIEMWCYEDVK